MYSFIVGLVGFLQAQVDVDNSPLQQQRYTFYPSWLPIYLAFSKSVIADLFAHLVDRLGSIFSLKNK